MLHHFTKKMEIIVNAQVERILEHRRLFNVVQHRETGLNETFCFSGEIWSKIENCDLDFVVVELIFKTRSSYSCRFVAVMNSLSESEIDQSQKKNQKWKKIHFWLRCWCCRDCSVTIDDGLRMRREFGGKENLFWDAS